MYTIKIDYSTGNSFGSHKEQCCIDFCWKTIELAKKNLHRIKEHYYFYLDMNSNSYPYKTKSDLEKILKEAAKKPWFNSEKLFGDYDTSSLYLELDNGQSHLYRAFWCGYFERLNNASIVLIEPNSDEDLTSIDF
jgi:hypothetical protein